MSKVHCDICAWYNRDRVAQRALRVEGSPRSFWAQVPKVLKSMETTRKEVNQPYYLCQDCYELVQSYRAIRQTHNESTVELQQITMELSK